MKTIFRTLMLGTVMTAATAVSVFAQDACTEVEAKQALYKVFTDNLSKKTIDAQQAAVDAGDQYVSKYGACAEDKQIVDYLNTNLPKMKEAIAGAKGAKDKQDLLNNFDAAVGGSKTADILTYGKQIAAKDQDLALDVTITMASAGFDQAIANPPVDSYNNDTINYSKQAILQLEADKPSKTGVYGVKQYSYKTDKFGGKENALGLMNYNIGYIMYYRQGKNDAAMKKAALPYFYKATQYNAFSKTDPFVYQSIGAWYLDESIRLDAQRLAKVKEAGGRDTDETLAIYGMEKAYAERSIDAYARAYKLATDTARKNALYDKLKQLYSFRYDKTDGIDAYVATVTNNPLPDPTTEPTPVKEAAPATPATTSGTAMTSDTTSENTAGMAKPTGAKGAVTTTAKPAAANTAKPKAATAKTPAPKKKGTR